MKATIISIGNELLNGKTTNSNASYIGGRLYDIGIVARQVIAVRDEPESIRESLRQAIDTSEVVIVTGGLGPTHDDITMEVAANFFGSKLALNEAVLQKIEARYRQRGIPMPESNLKVAMVPEKARLLNNALGTAPGAHFETQGADASERHLFILPGVPREMRAMMDESVIPFLQEKNTAGRIEVYLYRTAGVAESRLYQLTRSLLEAHPAYEVAFLPKETGTDMRVAVRRNDSKESAKFPVFEESLYQAVGEYIYTRGSEELEEVIGKLLRARAMTISAAESCTGGLLQDKITNIAGSSDYFMGGMVTYSNESKMKQLGVCRESLEKYGAVSEAAAKEMAAGVRRVFGTDVALSTTGIAGPGGATPEKPVGLIYIGLATADTVMVQKHILSGDRVMVKRRGAQAALELLRRELLGIESASS